VIVVDSSAVIAIFRPADVEEIIARAQAMQVGGTIGVAKVDVISQDKGVERLCAFATATMRAVEITAQMVARSAHDPARHPRNR
jgi:acyl-coenzyme A thioesterase PaaI-like protein